MNRNIEHKRIKSEIKKMEIYYNDIDSNIRESQKKLSQTKNDIDTLKKELLLLQEKPVLSVSDHAIVRFLERVYKLDIENVKKIILSDDVVNLVENLGGNGVYPNKEGFQVAIKQYNVTTIY